jgi:hypothetical protein
MSISHECISNTHLLFWSTKYGCFLKKSTSKINIMFTIAFQLKFLPSLLQVPTSNESFECYYDIFAFLTGHSTQIWFHNLTSLILNPHLLFWYGKASTCAFWRYDCFVSCFVFLWGISSRMAMKQTNLKRYGLCSVYLYTALTLRIGRRSNLASVVTDYSWQHADSNELQLIRRNNSILYDAVEFFFRTS